jgi:DDE superfamily endonuclease
MLRAIDSSTLDTFRSFRSSLYNCLHRRADAVFELTDAILRAEPVPSLSRVASEGAAASLLVFDIGCDPVKLQQGLEGCSVQSLVRLRADRRFYTDPSGSPARTGRPSRHESRFDCKDPNT